MSSPAGEAKFWLEPLIALATHTGLSPRELGRMQQVVEDHRDEIIRRWKAHFGG